LSSTMHCRTSGTMWLEGPYEKIKLLSTIALFQHQFGTVQIDGCTHGTATTCTTRAGLYKCWR
jgi:hypothetical protein